ncbi:hypothetical protein FJTKL_07721 [Diaporthe vaccinii]|uniref:Uncharacterized protein n=1 Tax=Diaporthe vaccinii TaxID=105482 RepID=A0ABR4ETH0_9PEZI
MQSEASEVTLGGKAHVGPGCVCATRHQPSWLDREFSFLLFVANERDRVCRGGGWWRLQESPRLSLAGGPGGKSGAVVRVRKRGKKGPPVPPLPPSRPPIHAPPLHTHARKLHPGSKARAETGNRLDWGWEGCVRAWADGQGRGGTGMRGGRAVWIGWMDQDAVGLFLVPGVTFSRAHLSPSGL